MLYDALEQWLRLAGQELTILACADAILTTIYLLEMNSYRMQ